MLSAARQRLAAGGYVIVRDPIAGENAERAVQDGEKWTTFFGLNPPGTTRFLARAEWTSQFEQTGLTLVSEAPCGHGNVLFVLRASD
jgi:hypothetical protein